VCVGNETQGFTTLAENSTVELFPQTQYFIFLNDYKCIKTLISFSFLWYWGLNSGPTWTTPPVLFLWWIFLRWGLTELFFPGLASNHDPPDLCLLSG
jgi:hypothetical protein